MSFHPPTINISLMLIVFSATAFWLRSSVVSVLFSLISEIRSYIGSRINLIFALRGGRPLCSRMSALTVSLVSHCLQSMRIQPFIVALAAAREGKERRSPRCYSYHDVATSDAAVGDHISNQRYLELAPPPRDSHLLWVAVLSLHPRTCLSPVECP